MAGFAIDARAADAIGNYCLGEYAWAGFLVGRRSERQVLGCTLVPAERQSRDAVEIWHRLAEILAELLHARFERTIELMGPLIVARERPAPETVRDYSGKWRGFLGEGCCLIYSTPEGWLRKQRRLVCYEIATALEERVSRAELLVGSERSALEEAVGEYWNRIAEALRADRGGEAAAATPTIRCTIDEKTLGHVETFARYVGRVEIGGVMLGTRETATRHVLGAVFPQQMRLERVACEFSTSWFQDLCEALKDINDRRSERGVPELQPVGWVHTHPHLGVFLSTVDADTFRNWCALDPGAVALVMDPFAPGEECVVYGRGLTPVVAERSSATPPGGFDMPEAERLATLLRHCWLGTGMPWTIICPGGPARYRGRSPGERPAPG